MTGTRHPQMGAAELPRGNSAGTIMESAPYSQQPRKHWRLQVPAASTRMESMSSMRNGRLAVTGAVTRGCCGVNVLKAKGRSRNGHPGAACAAYSLRCGGRQGASPLRGAPRTRALDRHPRCGCFPAMRKMYFSHVPHDPAQGGDPRGRGQQRRVRSGSGARSAGAVAGIRGARGAVLEARHHP
jgi:hypothetical protein